VLVKEGKRGVEETGRNNMTLPLLL
jgi:hypothetical protein